ncbi:dipeptidase PepE [Aliikangiella sp. IMCC44653]
MRLLLLSSSRAGNSGYLETAIPAINEKLDGIKEVLFVPYAGVTVSYDQYLNMVQQALAPSAITVKSVHQFDDPKQAIIDADAILVGGGNTFRLLERLYHFDLIDTICDQVKNNTLYIGWSAGANIAGPTIKTTNDMPIIQPASFNALKLFPCQLNPHYIEGNPPGHNGETREQRINEYLTLNPNGTVIGIPEGSWISVEQETITYHGKINGVCFKASGRQAIKPSTNLQQYWNH